MALIKPFYSKHKQLIPVLVLLSLSIYSAFQILTGSVIIHNKVAHFNFTIEHYAAWTALALCLLSYFLLRRYYKYVLGATLILGLFGVLNFIRDDNKFSLGLNALVITFQPASFVVGLLTLAINGDKVNDYFVRQRKRKKEEVHAEEVLQFKSDLGKYKSQYQNASDEELSKVMNDQRYTPGAKEAARLILEERRK